MLNTNVEEILFADGKVSGIKSNGETAKAPLIICDPSYVQTLKKVKPVGKVIRAICILDHPIPSTYDASSIQIIIPQKQLNRKSGKNFLPLTVFRYLRDHGESQPCSMRQGLLHCYHFYHC